MVDKERKKISLQNKSDISAKLLSENEAISRKLNNGNYSIEIGGFFAKETTLKHELYHILDGHCDDIEKIKSPFSELKYLFWYEPQAAMYESTGLKF